MLKELGTHCVDGLPTSDVCRKHGLSSVTLYNLKAKYGGMEVSEVARLKALEVEVEEVEKDQQTIRGIVCPTNGTRS